MHELRTQNEDRDEGERMKMSMRTFRLLNLPVVAFIWLFAIVGLLILPNIEPIRITDILIIGVFWYMVWASLIIYGSTTREWFKDD